MHEVGHILKIISPRLLQRQRPIQNLRHPPLQHRVLTLRPKLLQTNHPIPIRSLPITHHQLVEIITLVIVNTITRQALYKIQDHLLGRTEEDIG